MREKKKKQELSKGWRPKFLLKIKSCLHSVLSGGFYSQAPIQITKNYKSKHYYKEKVGRKPKREQKVKKSNGQQEQCWKLKQCVGVKISQPVKISHVAKFSQSYSISSTLLSTSLFF